MFLLPTHMILQETGVVPRNLFFPLVFPNLKTIKERLKDCLQTNIFLSYTQATDSCHRDMYGSVLLSSFLLKQAQTQKMKYKSSLVMRKRLRLYRNTLKESSE